MSSLRCCEPAGQTRICDIRSAWIRFSTRYGETILATSMARSPQTLHSHAVLDLSRRDLREMRPPHSLRSAARTYGKVLLTDTAGVDPCQTVKHPSPSR